MSKIIKSCNVCIGEFARVEPPDPGFEDQQDEIIEDDILDEDIRGLDGEDMLEHAEERAREIISNAKAEAKKVFDETMAKVEEEREIVLEQAKKNGFEEGYNQALSQCEDIIQEAGRLKQQALEESRIYLNSIQDEVVTVILDVARKVVGFEVSFNKEDILYIVREALESCMHKNHIVLRVSGDDYDYIVKSRDKLMAMVQGIGELEIKTDHSLETGSCLLETPYGSIDGSVNTRLDEIEKVFRGLIDKD